MTSLSNPAASVGTPIAVLFAFVRQGRRATEQQCYCRDFMKARRPLPNLPFSGERLLLPTNLGLLVLSVFLPVSLRLHTHELWSFGVIGLLLSPASLVLSCWELWRYQHQWRTIVAALISLLATGIGWATVVFHVTGKL